MARWNYYPKFRIIKWDAYTLLNVNPQVIVSKLNRINGLEDSYQLHHGTTALFHHFEQIAASFTPVKAMSQTTKDKMYSIYKYAATPIKIHMMQLNNKRVEIK